jgi:DNA-binding transcriptional ArsR family regulator
MTEPAGDPFNALGDAHRRFIVEMLRAGGRPVREIADALPISRPAVSRHLRLLKDAGLVVEEARGTQRIYRLHDEGVAAVQAYLTRVWGEAAARMRLYAENTRPPRGGKPGAPQPGRPGPASEPGGSGSTSKAGGPDQGRP